MQTHRNEDLVFVFKVFINLDGDRFPRRILVHDPYELLEILPELDHRFHKTITEFQ